MWETGRESLKAAALEQEGRRANGDTADSDILLADDGLVQTSRTGHQKAPEYSYIRDGCRNLKYARGCLRNSAPRCVTARESHPVSPCEVNDDSSRVENAPDRAAEVGGGRIMI